MNKIYIISFIVILVAVLSLTYAIIYTRLKEVKKKIDRTETAIDDALINKATYIVKINEVVTKKLDNDKYLKEFIDLDNQNLTKIEKDIKLTEAFKLIKKLSEDYSELNEEDFIDIYRKLKVNEEKLVSAKELYNKYVEASNHLIRKFPYSIVAKINKFRIRAFFNTNEK